MEQEQRTPGFFITGTDTGVGKTVVMRILGVLWRRRGVDVGMMKPVQCSGTDAEDLVNALDIRDEFDLVNPYYADEPLSPNVAFSRAGGMIRREAILRSYRMLADRHDLMLVEGAGGFLVPLVDDYLVADLARDLDLPVVIVARPGLGTINHTLLTIRAVRDYGLTVAGVIFSNSVDGRKGVAEATNPEVIRRLGDVPVLGTIPYLKTLDEETIVETCLSGLVLLDWNKDKRESAILQAQDKAFVWHPFTQMRDWLKDDPLVIDRARGNDLIDVEGRHYLDGVSSLWVNVHGHGHPRIDRALQSQVGRLSHSTLLGLANTPSIELARELVAIAPAGLGKVFYSDNGSTAVEIAIKLAYQYWQNIGQKARTKIVHMADSYHGDTLGSVSVGGIDLFHKVYRGLIFEALKFTFPSRNLEECARAFEAFILEHHTRLAAFVTEPGIQGAAGMIVWPQGLLKAMAETCQRYDVFLIVDEVATGFGRTGTMFACEQEGVTPDFLCLAKGLTGGCLPLAATLVQQKIYDGFLFDYRDMKAFFHGHTYTGNPLACAAALANLEIFKEENVISRLASRISYLRDALRNLESSPFVGEIRQKGLMVGIELMRDRATKESFALDEKAGARVCRRARERGVLLRPLGNVVVLMPPLSVSRRELKTLVEAVAWAMDAELGGGKKSGKGKRT